MSKPPKIFPTNYIQQYFFVNPTLIRKLKSHATETGQTFFELINPEYKLFEAALTKKMEEIDEIRMKQYGEMLRQKEMQQLAAESPPIKVSGHIEDPIGNVEKIIEPKQIF